MSTQPAAIPPADADLVDTAPVKAQKQPTDGVPEACDLVRCVATRYAVSYDTAAQWLVARAADIRVWLPDCAEAA